MNTRFIPAISQSGVVGWGFIFNNIFKQVKCKKSVDT